MSERPISIESVQLFTPNVVDYDKIKGWVFACKTTHDQELGTTINDLASFPGGENYTLRRIDVFEGRVVIADARARYVALSYVWVELNSFN
jgi:hypothetical protein